MHHSKSSDRRRAQDLALARDLIGVRRIQAGLRSNDTRNAKGCETAVASRLPSGSKDGQNDGRMVEEHGEKDRDDASGGS
jgi:hypothetical protein